MSTWLSLLCPSCRPHDLKKWLGTLYDNCTDPKSIELSLTLEEPLWEGEAEKWGRVVTTIVQHGQYNINQLHEITYKQSTSPYIFMSGDDTTCETFSWDAIFKSHIEKYPDNVVLVYPNDKIFKAALACYPVTSRLVMDSVPWPVPFIRYAIDDTIFDIVPQERRIYLDHVVMRHNHLNDAGIYPIDQEKMAIDRPLYEKMAPLRAQIRNGLRLKAGINHEMKLLIGIPTQEVARRADFYDYFNMLDKPVGTGCTFSHGQSPAHGRNLIIDQAIQNDFTHILFLDDDVAFKPDLIYKLARHNVDIVCGFQLMRNYPHRPIVFKSADAQGRCQYFYPNGHKGLVEIVACGLGCCLIKTSVFHKLEKPFIRLGELESDQWCDDIGFFKRVREAGFKIHCDLDTPIGHMAHVTVWPNKKDDKWSVAYDSKGEGVVEFQAHVEDLVGAFASFVPSYE